MLLSKCKITQKDKTQVNKQKKNRQFTMELGNLVVLLDGLCTAHTCPLMKCTDEWEYFCAAHDPPKQVFINLLLFHLK